VTSPISGTVDAVGLRVWRTSQSGHDHHPRSEPLGYESSAKVADTYINTVRKGDEAQIELNSGEKMTGKVSFVGKVVNPQTRTFDVEIALPNKGGLLKPNMLANININDQTKENAWW
jgi:multidrug efflux pump subunit AcrA (membrane-fusion protein)